MEKNFFTINSLPMFKDELKNLVLDFKNYQNIFDKMEIGEKQFLIFGKENCSWKKTSSEEIHGCVTRIDHTTYEFSHCGLTSVNRRKVIMELVSRSCKPLRSVTKFTAETIPTILIGTKSFKIDAKKLQNLNDIYPIFLDNDQISCDIPYDFGNSNLIGYIARENDAYQLYDTSYNQLINF